jgi:hypothetical protein
VVSVRRVDSYLRTFRQCSKKNFFNSLKNHIFLVYSSKNEAFDCMKQSVLVHVTTTNQTKTEASEANNMSNFDLLNLSS